MWFPVDPVDRSATLEFVAGTNRGPWYMPRTFLDDQAKWFPDGTLAELPDFVADPHRWRVIGWELEPGDAVYFNMLTVHGSGGVSGNPTADGFCRSATSAMTWCTHRGDGPPRRRSRGSTPNWRVARRWNIRCSRCCGHVTEALVS